MKPIERYQRFGLDQPISFHPSIGFHLLAWGGGSFLIVGCIIAIASGVLIEQLLGIFGMIFFGLFWAIFFLAWKRSKINGMLVLSKYGLYMGHIGHFLPWSDIGGAWIQETNKEVVFLLRNFRDHSSKMDVFSKNLIYFWKMQSHSKSGGLLDWCVKVICLGSFGFWGPALRDLERMRSSVIKDSDSTVYPTFKIMFSEISHEELADIINREVQLNKNSTIKNPKIDLSKK
jgi:hypothetical protein